MVPLPGGAEAKYTSSGLSVYRMPDWLGSLRADSNPNRTYNGSLAFAPFGERYSVSGTPAYAFTGARPDIVQRQQGSSRLYICPSRPFCCRAVGR